MGAVQVVTQGFALIVYVLLTLLAVVLFVNFICWIISMAIPPFQESAFFRFIQSIVNPIVQPFRGIIPAVNGVDFFSFMFAIIFVYIIRGFVGMLASASFIF
jgi:uncharacterized protein YggT (Ycf19 family)